MLVLDTSKAPAEFALEALPVRVPSTLARSVPAVSVRSPVDAPVAVVVANVNLSSDSSYPIKTLF